MNERDLKWNIALVVALPGTLIFTGDWLTSVAVGVLWAIWRFLQPKEGPPVLAFALTFQWSQVTCGLFYTAYAGPVLLTNGAAALTETVVYSLIGILMTIA